MSRPLSLVALAVIVAGVLPAGSASESPSARDAYLEEIAALTAGSGRWIADNAEYRSEQEPYDAYGTEWRAAFDGTTLTGRLFGLVEGREVATFWEFRHYWHPGRQEAVVEQFGRGGALGIGTASYADGRTRTRQTFYYANGSEGTVGHVSFFPDAATHVTESFDVNDGEWLPRRRYVWRLAETE